MYASPRTREAAPGRPLRSIALGLVFVVAVALDFAVWDIPTANHRLGIETSTWTCTAALEEFGRASGVDVSEFRSDASHCSFSVGQKADSLRRLQLLDVKGANIARMSLLITGERRALFSLALGGRLFASLREVFVFLDSAPPSPKEQSLLKSSPTLDCCACLPQTVQSFRFVR